jgi:tetratricopeptide (TPR) repeat protein
MCKRFIIKEKIGVRKMRSLNSEKNEYEKIVQKAIFAIKNNEFEVALKYLQEAMMENMHSAEIQNLLGVIAEKSYDLELADKHYRAAYSLDPTYKPADKNLERITCFEYKINSNNIDLGDLNDESFDSYHMDTDSLGIKTVKSGDSNG